MLYFIIPLVLLVITAIALFNESRKNPYSVLPIGFALGVLFALYCTASFAAWFVFNIWKYIH